MKHKMEKKDQSEFRSAKPVPFTTGMLNNQSKLRTGGKSLLGFIAPKSKLKDIL